MHIFVITNIIYIYDIGMGQLGRRLRFLTEPDDEIVVVSVFCEKDLDGDNTI